jgi:hypothetical protein
VVSVMISCKARYEARDETIRGLVPLGIVPRVFLSDCNPPSTNGIMLVALEALRWAESKRDDVLFMEDDIIVTPDLLVALKRCSAERKISYLYINDTPERLRKHHGDELAQLIESGGPIVPGNYPVLNAFGLFGTQCVFIPKEIVVDLIKYCLRLRRGKTPFDGGLLMFIRDKRVPVTVALPHPVQHRVVKVLHHGGPVSGAQLSMSFGLPKEEGTPGE